MAGFFTSVWAQKATWKDFEFSGDPTKDGGLLRVDLALDGREVADRTGDQNFPAFLIVVDGAASAQVTMRDLTLIDKLTQNDVDDLIMYFKGKMSNADEMKVYKLTMKNAVFIKASPSQGRGEPGQMMASFSHRSEDGSTFPFTVEEES